MPFRFLDEIATADVAFEAWGETREELFSSAAAALLRTMVAEPDEVEFREELTIRMEHPELDLLLCSFLQELVFLKDARRLLLHAAALQIGERDGLSVLEAVVRGEEIDHRRHRLLVDVKAVTLHRLRVAFEDQTWRGTVVLDV